jgi:hypothetical protein
MAWRGGCSRASAGIESGGHRLGLHISEKAGQAQTLFGVFANVAAISRTHHCRITLSMATHQSTALEQANWRGSVAWRRNFAPAPKKIAHRRT